MRKASWVPLFLALALDSCGDPDMVQLHSEAVVVLLSMYLFIVLGVPEKPEDKLFYMGAVVKAVLYIGVAIEAVVFVYYPETKKRKHPPRVSASF